MSDSITPNPWRPDPAGGLVYQDLELRHAQGAVQWTDETGEVHARITSDDWQGLRLQAVTDGIGNSLSITSDGDGLGSEIRAGGQLIIDGAGGSSFVRSDHGEGHFRLRAGSAVIDVSYAYIPAQGARDYPVSLGSAGDVPDYVLAQITDGGSLYYGFTLAGTGNYRSLLGIPHFDATVQSHINSDMPSGHLWLNYLAIYHT